MNEICPKCNKKSLRERLTDKVWKCGNCHSIFDIDKRFVLIDKENKIYRDHDGNFAYPEFEYKPGIIIFKTIYLLENNKTTLRGKYSKLKCEKDCKLPERLDCNGGIGYIRCEYMKYENQRWLCKYELEKK